MRARRAERRTSGHRRPVLVRVMRRLEGAVVIDRADPPLRAAAGALLRSRQHDLLLGMPLGHAAHPLLTDISLGSLTAANLLDVLGGRDARPAAERLLACGLASAAPTILTGLAEWGTTSGRERRVGVVHAMANTAALTSYGASLVVRRRGRHGLGVLLAAAGASFASAGGYLGGHLTAVRKVSSRHPGFVGGIADECAAPAQEAGEFGGIRGGVRFV